MARFLISALTMGAVLLSASLSRAQQMTPDTITIHVLDGNTGVPLPHAHLVLLGGYIHNDIRLHLWQEEALTDAQGNAILPKSLETLDLLEVWVAKHKLCQIKGRSVDFSINLIRRDGVSTPNQCGTMVVEAQPGVFNVFAKASAKDLPAAPKSETEASSASSEDAAPAGTSAAAGRN